MILRLNYTEMKMKDFKHTLQGGLSYGFVTRESSSCA